MAKSDKQRQVTAYPEATAAAIVGGRSAAINWAIECWAQMLREAMPMLEPDEWNYLADALKDVGLLGTAQWGRDLAIAAVEDAHHLRRLGETWLHDNPAAASAAVVALLDKIQEWSYVQTQYVFGAIAFRWADQLCPEEAWWELGLRVQTLTKEK